MEIENISTKMKNSTEEKVKEIYQQIEQKDKKIKNMNVKCMETGESTQDIPHLNFRNFGKREQRKRSRGNYQRKNFKKMSRK